MAEGAGDEGFLHISDHFFLPAFAYFALLAVQERGPEFITTSFADLGLKGDFVGLLRVVQAFNNYVEILPLLVLAKLPVFEIGLKFISADETGVVVLERIFDDVGTFVADFAELGDLVDGFGFLFAGQFDDVGQTFLEVVAAQRYVLRLVVDHIYFK